MNNRTLMKWKVLYRISKRTDVWENVWESDPFLELDEVYFKLLWEKQRIKETRFDKDKRKGGI